MDYDNGLLVDGSHCLDQLVSVVPWVQIVTITSIPLDRDVALTTVAVDANHSDISLLGCASTLLRVVVWRRSDCCAIFLSLRLDGIERSDKVGELD
jgi:hypothetical protein